MMLCVYPVQRLDGSGRTGYIGTRATHSLTRSIKSWCKVVLRKGESDGRDDRTVQVVVARVSRPAVPL